MTLVALAILGCLWVAYFVYCLRDSASSPRRPAKSKAFSSDTRAFNTNLDALGASLARSGRSSFGSTLAPSRPSRFLDFPRTPKEADMRRRKVVLVLAAVAFLALVAVPKIGAVGLAIHLLADVALLGFASVSSFIRHRSAEIEMNELMLNGGRPASPTSRQVGPKPLGQTPIGQSRHPSQREMVGR